MTRKLSFVLSLIVLLACFGCGKKNSEKVQGVWRTAEKQGHVHGFIEIGKDKLIKDGDDSVDVALDDKDDKVSIRVAGTDQVIAVATVIDDDNIEIAFQGMFGGKLKLVKSSAEEMNAAFNPPVANITGIWRGEKEEGGPGLYRVLEITPDAMVFDGNRVPVTIATRKGVYQATSAQGDSLGELVLGADGRLSFGGLMRMGETFVRSSPEEAATIGAARAAFVEGFYGFWKEIEPRYGQPYAYLEIAAAYVDEDGERTEADLVRNGDRVKAVSKDGNEVMTLGLGDDGRLEMGKGYFGRKEYERSSREELKKINNPKLEDVAGFWLLDDAEMASYQTVELAPDYIVRDRRREETKLMEGGDRFALAIARREPKEMHWFDVIRVDADHMIMSYGSYDKRKIRYRRAAREDYEKAAAGLTNPLDLVSGYWRSAEPVKDTRGNSEVYATAVFASNVQGENGKPVDWSNVSFIDSSAGMRNRSLGDGGRAREGVWVYFNGDVTRSFELMRTDGNNGTWVQVKIVDADTLDIAVDGRNFVRCVRSNQEEVVRLRAAIKQ